MSPITELIGGAKAYGWNNYFLSVPGDYESIATVSVGSGGVSTANFTSIPSTYKHLQIRGIARSSDTGSGAASIAMRFNSDTGTNYNFHYFAGRNGLAFAAGQTFIYTEGYFGVMPSNGHPANTFSSFVVDILDYTNTNKLTTIRCLSGFTANGTGTEPDQVQFMSSLWNSTSAITSISILRPGGSNLMEYSHMALYGIKGAA